MTSPPNSPPDTVGLDPRNATEVNTQVGTHLRALVADIETIAHDKSWLAGADLTLAPYLFTTDQQTLIKSAILGADAYLQAMDMTFINQLTGLF
jgi:hypothetical protein